ncbi:MAG: hypothetical protein QM705_01900 [Ancrocorticia sp.]
MKRKFVVKGIVLPCVAAMLAVSACSSPQASEPNEGGASSSVSGTATELIYPDVELAVDNVPQEAINWLSEEIASFTHPFPFEKYLPKTISDLGLGIEGTVVTEPGSAAMPADDDTLLLQMTESEGGPGSISISRGDMYSKMADRWYCSWVDEHLQATDASDTARQKRALDYLKGFTDDELVTQFAINVPIYQEGILTPLEQGDLEPARSLTKSCAIFIVE